MRRAWRGGDPQREAAQRLRRAATAAERHLWAALSQADVPERIRRQHPVGGYIADFYVPAAALVIELDGGVHDDTRDRDEQRTDALALRGVRVIRFSNTEVFADVDAVVRAICLAILA
jgi:very-short-patch-repair endonuclease